MKLKPDSTSFCRGLRIMALGTPHCEMGPGVAPLFLRKQK